MYLIAVILHLLLFIFPAASVFIEVLRAGSGADWMLLVGKWFVFWAVGVRLFIAGLRQVFQPRFTAETIFEIKDESVYAVVREVGFGNISIGASFSCTSPRHPLWNQCEPSLRLARIRLGNISIGGWGC